MWAEPTAELRSSTAKSDDGAVFNAAAASPAPPITSTGGG